MVPGAVFTAKAPPKSGDAKDAKSDVLGDRGSRDESYKVPSTPPGGTAGPFDPASDTIWYPGLLRSTVGIR